MLRSISSFEPTLKQRISNIVSLIISVSSKMRTLKQLLSIMILVTCKPSKSSSSTSLMSEENKELVFQPMQGTTVSGTCQWEIWTSKNSRRIPSEITEVYCAGAGMSCERNPMFQVIAIGFFCNFFQKKKEIHLDRYLSIIDQTKFLHLTRYLHCLWLSDPLIKGTIT